MLHIMLADSFKLILFCMEGLSGKKSSGNFCVHCDPLLMKIAPKMHIFLKHYCALFTFVAGWQP